MFQFQTTFFFLSFDRASRKGVVCMKWKKHLSCKILCKKTEKKIDPDRLDWGAFISLSKRFIGEQKKSRIATNLNIFKDQFNKISGNYENLNMTNWKFIFSVHSTLASFLERSLGTRFSNIRLQTVLRIRLTTGDHTFQHMLRQSHFSFGE